MQVFLSTFEHDFFVEWIGQQADLFVFEHFQRPFAL
jgi:hypothetical protein